MLVSLCLKYHTLDRGTRKILIKFTSDVCGSNASHGQAGMDINECGRPGTKQQGMEEL